MASQIIVVLLVVCAIQGLFALPTTDTSEQDWEDTFNSVINKLNNSLNDATKFINKQSQKLENAIGGELKKGFDVVDQKIQEVTKEATEKGIDIGPCVDAEKNDVNKDIDKLTQDAVGCISNLMKSAISDLQSVVNAISETEKAIVDAKDNIKSCDKKSKWKKAECIAEKTAKAAASAADADKKAVQDIKNLAELYTSYPLKIKQCESGVLGEATTDAKNFAEKVALCVIF